MIRNYIRELTVATVGPYAAVPVLPTTRGGKGPYLPGNAGLLYAIAGMCVGFDETSEGEEASSGDTAPGFPEGWNVKWEGLRRPL